MNPNEHKATAQDAPTVFAFEAEFVQSLRCIPMCVRFKLDQCGVKLSLRHWGQFTREERDQLLNRTCASPEEVAGYKQGLVELIESRSGEKAKPVMLEATPAWEDIHHVPSNIVDLTLQLGLPTPSLGAWAALNPFQRFALTKLTRPGHENENFVPALREFGLLR